MALQARSCARAAPRRDRPCSGSISLNRCTQGHLAATIRQCDVPEKLACMQDPFLDSTTMEGQLRIREYVLRWLERLDYGDRLDRTWSPDDLGTLIWTRVAQEFGAFLPGRVVTNTALAEVIAATMVEDYFAAYPERRPSRYSVAGPLMDSGFRRCVLDFLHDLEEFEPAALPEDVREAADVFWYEVRTFPQRWGYSVDQGPFVDDQRRAEEVALETIRNYFDMLRRAAELREGSAGE